MHKFSIYLAFIFMLAVLGCGDNSGDPTSRISLTVSPAEGVAPGGSAIITATVTKPGGTVKDTDTGASTPLNAWGEKVTFKLLTANGASLSTLIEKTDGNGVATTIYTAGNNYNQDVVQAVLENGMYASVVITKAGGPTGAGISSLVASDMTVDEGQTTVIRATVTDGNSTNPIMGTAVTFTIASNESGGCFINATNACVAGVTVNSDALGIAEAVYKAGGNSSTIVVYDSVRASLSNGSSRAVVIERNKRP